MNESKLVPADPTDDQVDSLITTAKSAEVKSAAAAKTQSDALFRLYVDISKGEFPLWPDQRTQVNSEDVLSRK